MNEIPLAATAYIRAFLITLPLCLLLLAMSRKREGALSRFSVLLLRLYQAGFIILFVFLLLPVQFRLLPYKPDISTVTQPELSMPEEFSAESEGFYQTEPVLPAPDASNSLIEEPAVPGPDLKNSHPALSFGLYFLLIPGIALFAGQNLRKLGFLRRLKRSGSESFFGRMRIIRTSGADTAFSCGVFRKNIFIPASYKAGSDFRIAIIHEGHHHRNQDPFWLNIHHLLACLFWFNPVHLLVYLKAKQGHEFACDDNVLESVPLNKYLHSLMRAADMHRLASRRPLSHLLTGKNRLKERITIMIRKEKQDEGRLSGKRRKRLYAVITGAALSFAFMFGFVSKVTAQDGPSASKMEIAEVLKLVEKGDRDQAKLLLDKVSIKDYLASLDSKHRELVPFRNPLGEQEYYVSMTYGDNIHPINRNRFFHNGIDLAAGRGSAVYPVCPGKVIDIGISKSGDSSENSDNILDMENTGSYVVLEHADGICSIYTHLDSVAVTPGQPVTSDDKIGTLGNTGLSTGPHLHCEIRLGLNGLPLNPVMFIDFPRKENRERVQDVNVREKPVDPAPGIAEILDLVNNGKMDQANLLFEKISVRGYLDSLEDRTKAPFQNPLTNHQYRILINFGPAKDPVDGHDFYHYGLDLAAEKGTPVHPACEGKVTRVGMDEDHDYYLEIRHANGFSSFYGHLEAVAVKTGQSVKPDTIIGIIGNNGKITDSYIHFDVRYNNSGKYVVVNPRNFIQFDTELN